MLKYLIQSYAVTEIPLAVLLLFCCILGAVIAWVYRPGSKKYYKNIAQSIIHSGESHHG